MSSGFTRRRLLAGALSGAALASPYVFVRGARAANKQQVVISGWGGATQQAMREAYFKPFFRDTGIQVVEQTYGEQGLARIKAQLREGATQVDLLDGAPFWTVVGRKQGLLGKIAVPGLASGSFMPGAIGEYGFGYATVSWGITCLRQKSPTPRTWSQFWNTQAFKGRRAMFGPFVARHPEYALMADGVAQKDVYPLNDASIERAFAKLRKLAPAIKVWYQTGAQCEQLLLDKQIDMCEFFSGRTFFLQDQGVPVDYVWNEAVMNILTFVLAKSSPNYENAMKFLAYIAQPEPQAVFASSIYYGPTNPKALQLIRNQKTLERLPTYAPNLKQQIVLDANWWGENVDRIAPRWSQLISG